MSNRFYRGGKSYSPQQARAHLKELDHYLTRLIEVRRLFVDTAKQTYGEDVFNPPRAN